MTLGKPKNFWLKKKKLSRQKRIPALTIYKLNTHKKLHRFFLKKKTYLTKQFIWRAVSQKSTARFFPYTVESFGKNYSTKLINTLGNRLFIHVDKYIVALLISQIKKSNFFVDQGLQKITTLASLKNVRNRIFYRLRKKLPLRGQRTHTNARTRRRRNVQ